MSSLIEPVSLKSQMADLLSARDIVFDNEGEWLIPYGELPAIRTSWLAGENSGRLDVEVLLPDNRVIYECFAGMGQQEEGIKDALNSFVLNSFPVLLAAFWKVDDPEQVTTQEWLVSGKLYTAFVGSISFRASVEADASIPDGFVEAIESTIKNETGLLGTHWFRCFFCNVAEQHTVEALANNEPWTSGIDAVKNLPWDKAPGYYGVRQFIVLRENV